VRGNNVNVVSTPTAKHLHHAQISTQNDMSPDM